MGEDKVIAEAVVESLSVTKRNAGQEAPGSVHANARDAMALERQRMAQELEGLQKRFDERLAHQRQVIENLSEARKAALNHIDELHAFVETLVEAGTLTGSRELTARQLLRWEE